MNNIFTSFQKAIADVLSVTNYSGNKEEFVSRTFSTTCANSLLDIFEVIPEDKLEKLSSIAEKKTPQELFNSLTKFIGEKEYYQMIEENFRKTLLSLIQTIYDNATDLEKIKLRLIIEEFASAVKSQ